MFHLSGKVVVEPVDVFPELRVDRDDQGGGITLLIKPAQKNQFVANFRVCILKNLHKNLKFGKCSSFECHHLKRPAPPRAVTMKQPMMALTGWEATSSPYLHIRYKMRYMVRRHQLPVPERHL